MSETLPTTPASGATARGAQAPARGSLLRAAIWVAIGAIIVAAILCVVWVLIGDDNAIIARAFWTVALLAAFAGMVLLEVGLSAQRPQWVTIAAIGCWVIVLLLGAVKIWMPEAEGNGWDWVGVRLFEFIMIVAIVQLTFLHQRIMWRALTRVPTAVNRVIVYITSGLLIVLAGMLVFSLTFPREFIYDSLYWRIVVSLAILAAVGSALLPLINALFAPRRPAMVAPSAPGSTAWPTYPDGRTPLPMLPDGQPDFRAFLTPVPEAMAATPQPAPQPAPHAYGAVPAWGARPVGGAQQSHPAYPAAPGYTAPQPTSAWPQPPAGYHPQAGATPAWQPAAPQPAPAQHAPAGQAPGHHLPAAYAAGHHAVPPVRPVAPQQAPPQPGPAQPSSGSAVAPPPFAPPASPTDSGEAPRRP